MRKLNSIVMYLWRKYPWTIGWTPIDELPGLGAEFTVVNLYAYYGMEPPSDVLNGSRMRMHRCTRMLEELHEEH